MHGDDFHDPFHIKIEYSQWPYRYVAFCFAIFIVIAIAAVASGQVAPKPTTKVIETVNARECSGGVCRIATYQWVEMDNDPGRFHLLREGRHLGGWDRKDRYWRDYNHATGEFGERKDCAPLPVPESNLPAVDPPKKLPNPPAELIGQVENHGVNLDQIGNERYTCSGRECSGRQFWAMTGHGIPDDSKLKYLTVFGSQAERERVLKDLRDHPALAEWRGQFRIHGYDPTHWIASRGFNLGQGLTLFVQAADGTEEMRCDGYEGAERLADRLRRKPADPDKPSPPKPLDGLRDISAATDWLKKNWLIPVAIVIAGILLFRRK